MPVKTTFKSGFTIKGMSAFSLPRLTLYLQGEYPDWLSMPSLEDTYVYVEAHIVAQLQIKKNSLKSAKIARDIICNKIQSGQAVVRQGVEDIRSIEEQNVSLDKGQKSPAEAIHVGRIHVDLLKERDGEGRSNLGWL